MSLSAVLLNGLVALPFGFAVLTRLLDRRGTAALGVAVLGGVLTFAWSVWAYVDSSAVLDGTAVDHPWIAGLGVRWHLGLDGISGPLVLMSTLVIALCLVSLVRHDPVGGARGDLAALLLLIEAGVLGSFLALDLVLFFVFFEVALIPMWFVINGWGDRHDEPGRARAATRFLVFTVLGSALMLVGFVLVRSQAGTFDIVRIAATYQPSGATGVTAAVLVVLGLAVKTPLWPLHIWLPDAHSKAPTVGSVVLAAVLLKLGTYGLVRFWLPVADPHWRVLAPFVAGLAVVGIVYAALACLAQTEVKRLIAYSSVGHMGFVVLAVTTFTVGGVQAAVFASVAHGLITGLLFFLAGAIKDRFGTGELDRLSALYGTVPHLGALFAFAAMASLGLPGLAGFWGEMLSIRSALYPDAALPAATYTVLAVIAALGVILTSAYFLQLMRGMLQGTPAAVRPVNEDVDSIELATAEVDPGTPMAGASRADVDAAEWLTWSPLVVLTVVLGVAPGLLLGPVGEAARAFFGGPG
ncbi:NADH-quinone oxidoreductase subunit M [Nocardioides panacis]|uniref:NADH-quinone oxidoreductase subunit M n=1 Tax=Nocardioides panacis TaxID=2849501 RepID=A0A975XZ69_9ACTN|nr:NADH-quinone oxidoreductase subunit M [Nocardioides panacis]QWZ07115.1 NADH-quinone oxidoreductase subunit M [Nocardioides panacis]